MVAESEARRWPNESKHSSREPPAAGGHPGQRKLCGTKLASMLYLCQKHCCGCVKKR